MARPRKQPGADGGTGGGNGGENVDIRDAVAGNGNGYETIDPGSIPEDGGTSAAGTETIRKRRGRPAGSGGKTQKAKQTLDINGVESLLFSIHLALASVVKTPELALEKGEARALAEATANVARHYDLPAMPQQIIDWGNLIIVGATIYGTRAIAIRARVDKERRERKPAPAGNDAGLAPQFRPEPAMYTG